MVNSTNFKVDKDTDIPWRDSQIATMVDRGGVVHSPDLLTTIFAGQARLMERYEEIERANGAIVVPPEQYGEVDAREVQARLKDLAWRVTEEIGEAMQCLKNRPWKSSFVATDRDHYEEELADALHFFVELLITSGIDADRVFELYFLKHQVNQFRQASNY